MQRITISDNLKGEQLEKLLNIIALNSTKMSVARYNNMDISYEESLVKLKDSIIKHRLDYENNIDGLKDYLDKKYNIKSEIDDYFKNIYTVNIKSFEEQKPLIIRDDICLQDFDDFIEINYTNSTPVTTGPEFEIAYLKIGDTFQRLKTSMPSLFKYPYKIGEKCCQLPTT